MNRAPTGDGQSLQRIPRASGDEPRIRYVELRNAMYSPRERG